jgi:hypothetical protein
LRQNREQQQKNFCEINLHQTDTIEQHLWN